MPAFRTVKTVLVARSPLGRQEGRRLRRLLHNGVLRKHILLIAIGLAVEVWRSESLYYTLLFIRN